MTPQQITVMIRMKDSGQSNWEVAKHIGCNQFTVSKVYKQWKEETTVEMQKRSGRPRKTNEKMARVIWQTSNKDCFKCANLIRSCLLKHYGHPEQSGIGSMKGDCLADRHRRSCSLVCKTMCRRLEWARQHAHFLAENWKNVF